MVDRATWLRSTLSSTRSEDVSQDTRLGFIWVADRYGIRSLERLKRATCWVPANIPEKARVEALKRYSGLSDVVIQPLLRDLAQAAPSYLSNTEASEMPRRQLLTTSQEYCLNGCLYKEGPDRGKRRTLCWHREPTEVTIFSHSGEFTLAEHLILRCRGCESRYNYATWVNSSKNIYMFYPERRDLIRVTSKIFVTRLLAEHLQNSILFGHCPFEGYALIMQRTFDWPAQFSSKIVAEAHRKHQIQEDLWENNQMHYKFLEGRSIVQCVPVILERVFSSVYRHSCTAACKTKGCDKLAVVDGMWKIGARHCAAPVVNTVNGFPLINYPGVCTKPTQGNSVYCKNHSGYASSPPIIKTSTAALSEILVQGLSEQLYGSGASIDAILSPIGDKTDSQCPKFDPNEMCHKNKGEGERGLMYSRGYVFVVRGSGVIDCFAPIYRAESLGQVFLILVSWLYQRLQAIPVENWSDLFLAYDNMCQLDRLRATKQPLPLPVPFDMMWSKITKIIDGLHISNHKNPDCRKLYGPDKVKERFGDQFEQNTMAAEQTFSWMVKYKKQLNSMRKELQEFQIHRLCILRNRYVEECIRIGKPVVGSRRRAYNERRE